MKIIEKGQTKRKYTRIRICTCFVRTQEVSQWWTATAWARALARAATQGKSLGLWAVSKACLITWLVFTPTSMLLCTTFFRGSSLEALYASHSKQWFWRQIKVLRDEKSHGLSIQRKILQHKIEISADFGLITEPRHPENVLAKKCYFLLW